MEEMLSKEEYEKKKEQIMTQYCILTHQERCMSADRPYFSDKEIETMRKRIQITMEKFAKLVGVYIRQ